MRKMIFVLVFLYPFRPQYGEIEKIVEEVISILGYEVSSLWDDLDGMHSQVEQLEKLLVLDSDTTDDDVQVVGIGSKGVKLSKHAGSFNHKRLLPFLLNRMKDNCSPSVNVHYPKFQKFLDQTPLLPISASNLQVTSLSDSNGCIPIEHCTGNYGTQQQTVLHACDSSSSPKSQFPEVQSSYDSCKLNQLQDEQDVLNGLYKLERSSDPSISDHRIDLPITPLGPITNKVITREQEATCALSEPSRNSPFLIYSNEEKPHETHGCSQSLSQVKVLDQLTVPSVGFKKGILERRGCKGLCTCLNCVSFRLHADRAVEFSRNLLLDAEEVAQNLMKELSYLRNMLQRSTHNVHNNHVFDGSQVKEACSKAFATEQLAKDRLSQMNDDLNIHCRILSLQQLRVRPRL
ncbi:hypothetical protein SESBI_24395 [Sesbania bispinosa]|nr:hypothetical protein SESBI_24395 [Sesbania bispinosa]